MTYIGELRRLSHGCDFENVTVNQLIRDQIVCGVADDGLRKKLLQAKDLTLESCVSMCRTSEVASFQASSVAEDTRQVKEELDSEIHLVSHRKQWMEREEKKSANTGTDQIRCQFCGRVHKRGPSHCPAYGQRCQCCKRLNHFESQCRLKHLQAREVCASSGGFW